MVDAAQGPLAEVVLDGTPGEPTYDALRADVHKTLLPVALIIANAQAAESALTPAVFEAPPSLLEGRRAPDGGARAWICKRGVCLLPADDLATFQQQLPAVVKPVDSDSFARAIRDVGLYWMQLNKPPE